MSFRLSHLWGKRGDPTVETKKVACQTNCNGLAAIINHTCNPWYYIRVQLYTAVSISNRYNGTEGSPSQYTLDAANSLMVHTMSGSASNMYDGLSLKRKLALSLTY